MEMTGILETAGQYRVRLEIDQSPENPRTWQDNLCHVITVPDRHYADVDADGGPLQDGWNRIKDRDDADEVFTRWARIFHGAVVDFHTPARGPKSIWYLTPDGIAEVPDPEKHIRGEIEEYQNWADGEVYVYIIEKAVDWKRTDDEDETMTTWEPVEDGTCGHLIGYKYAEETALEEFAPYKKEPESKEA